MSFVAHIPGYMLILGQKVNGQGQITADAKWLLSFNQWRSPRSRGMTAHYATALWRENYSYTITAIVEGGYRYTTLLSTVFSVIPLYKMGCAEYGFRKVKDGCISEPELVNESEKNQ